MGSRSILVLWLSCDTIYVSYKFLPIPIKGRVFAAFSRSHRDCRSKVEYNVQKVLHGVPNPKVHINEIEKNGADTVMVMENCPQYTHDNPTHLIVANSIHTVAIDSYKLNIQC
jgi:hypothetical protein